MTAVVTGAAGFVGQTLVGQLLELGERVIGIDREPQPPRPGLTVLTADLTTDDELVAAALADAGLVFHLAGRPGVRDPRPDIAALRHRDNVLATAAVLAAVPPMTPLLVTSSSSVYGGCRPGRASQETDLLAPRGGYARSKLSVERLCAGRLAAGGAVVVARPFTIAGEGQRPDMALARWIAAARAGKPLRLLGSRQRTRDITDVRQAALALVALVHSGVRGPVNVGTGVGHSLHHLATTVARVLDVDVSSEVIPADPDEAPDTLADPTLLGRLIGWVPHTDLDDLVNRQAAAALGAEPVLAGAP